MFWAGDENCQWTTMDHADCLWESSRSSDQLQRRRGGRTWTCCSVEQRLDDVWRTVVDYERRHSRPACRSRTGTAELTDAGNETSSAVSVLQNQCVQNHWCTVTVARIQNYTKRRYGTYSPDVDHAWQLLKVFWFITIVTKIGKQLGYKRSSHSMS